MLGIQIWSKQANLLPLGNILFYTRHKDVLIYLFIYLLFFLFRAIPVAYGSSQARDQTGAAAAGLCHSHLSCICSIHHSLWQCQILNPLSKARDRTHILMATSQVLNLLNHNGNFFVFFIFKVNFIEV